MRVVELNSFFDSERRVNSLQLLHLSVSQLRSFTYRFHRFAPSPRKLGFTISFPSPSLSVSQFHFLNLLCRFHNFISCPYPFHHFAPSPIGFIASLLNRRTFTGKQRQRESQARKRSSITFQGKAYEINPSFTYFFFLRELEGKSSIRNSLFILL